MLVNSLFVLASAALALASPVKNYGPGSSCKPGKPMPTLPLNGGGKSIVSSLIHELVTNMIQPLNFPLLLKA